MRRLLMTQSHETSVCVVSVSPQFILQIAYSVGVGATGAGRATVVGNLAYL